VNQSAPSGPDVIALGDDKSGDGLPSIDGRAQAVRAREVGHHALRSHRPIRPDPFSVNQRSPSDPCVIAVGSTIPTSGIGKLVTVRLSSVRSSSRHEPGCPP